MSSWDSIAELYNNVSIDDNVIQIDSKDNYVRSNKRIIATIGVKDLIIVDSDNATLICKREYSEKVKQVVSLQLV